MGNALRSLCGDCFNPEPTQGSHGQSGGYSRLTSDLFQFENTGQLFLQLQQAQTRFMPLFMKLWTCIAFVLLVFVDVPEGLSQHVETAKKTQANWYKKILAAWKEENPRNGEQATILIVRALQGCQKVNVQGLLEFYGFPYPIASVPASVEGPQNWPKGVKYELHTLPVDPRAVADGDTITVFVDTRNPKESAEVPISIQEATIKRREARMKKDYARADALQKQINDAGYRVFDASRNGEDILARKYRIRLRGVDAPESQMPYGKEAKEALLSLVEGKPLHILIYDEDRYGRVVGDIYAGWIFIQEVLLKKGWAWHYSQYDQRPEFAKWQEEAKAARIGLWAASNPQKPWDWRKDKREGIPIATFA